MRRQDRAVTDSAEIYGILAECDVCRLAFNGDAYPYILTLNFGYEVVDGELTLFFHSALEGQKLDYLQDGALASFAMDTAHHLIYDEAKANCTMAYASVIGHGVIRRIEAEDEKARALRLLMDHYRPGTPISPEAVRRTLVYCLVVQSLTGKRLAAK